jgi:hypothetical protein
MTYETFTYHSNEEKKDFGNWVRDVIGDQKLARDLDRSSHPMQAAKRVAERVSFLSGRLA